MNETDRELLEWAAKAAGITCWIHCFGVPPYMGMRLNDGSIWNPLTNDGDAFRLALACGMQVREREACWWPSEHLPQHSIIEDDGFDPYAATRRAIVRAAAEIGKRMV